MSDLSFDMTCVDPDWELGEVIVCVIINAHIDGTLLVDAAVRSVVRAWYEDERDGFNADRIEIGGEG